MGYGTFDTTASAARAAFRAATGTSAFAHDAAARRGEAPCLHPALDVTRKPYRECRDSADSPTSVPIAVLLDVTGSMGAIPGLVLRELSQLMRMIQGRIVAYPQILFGAVGDAYCDRVPVQIGEFEADDERAEAHLANLFLEGGGGGQARESYELAMLFFARQVATDAWEKRGEKGFLFLIGDENYYPTVPRDQAQTFLGASLTENVATATVARELRQRWEVFLIRPGGTSHFENTAIAASWERILGREQVLPADDWRMIVPQIAGTIALMAGDNPEAAVNAMIASGFDPRIARTAGRTLSPHTFRYDSHR
ncbi:MAG: hypothetical protein SFU56_19405 [Capsulimonadales bacterium]|nr:hypothetical protein [Capsulimonadales bacterium]